MRISDASSAIRISVIVILCRIVCLNATLTIQDHAISGTYFAPVLRFPNTPIQFAAIENATVITTQILTNRSIIFSAMGWGRVLNQIPPFVNGSVLFMNEWTASYPHIKRMQDLGAVLIVFGAGNTDDGLGHSEYTSLGLPSTEDIRIPIVTIRFPLYCAIRDAIWRGENMTISIDDSSGPSPLHAVLASPTFLGLSVLEAVLSFSGVLIATIKMLKYLRIDLRLYGWPQMRLPYACLFLDGFGCLLRMLFWSIDPLCSRKLVSNGLQSTGRTASIPFALSSTCLLTFYWFETLTNSEMETTTNASRFKVPCYVSIMALFIFETTVSILQMAGQFSTILDYFTASLYLVFSLGLAAFFISTALRIFVVLRRLWLTSQVKKWTEQESKMRRQLFFTAIKFSVTGIALLVCVSSASLFVIRDLFLQARIWASLWLSIHTALNVKALATILAFKPSRSFPTETSGMKGSSSSRRNSSEGSANHSKFSLTLSNYQDTRSTLSTTDTV